MKTTVPLVGSLILSLLSLANAGAGEGRTFKAVDHARKTIYHSPEKPGFTSWVGAWILSGGLAHVDETHANLQDGKGYIWVVTNLEDVVYMYRPNRETAFLQGLLRDFKGVLVTDFYSGYDSLPCPQQKCLVHLIRDFNTDLMRHPYDEEFKALAAEFGTLLRSIVSTIDKYGFKKRHLHKHKADVAYFYRALESRVYRSELAESYQKRFLKNKDKLFVFLDHDGVPWNNNPAEHAVRNRGLITSRYGLTRRKH